MIRFVEHNDINREKWDLAIENSLSPTAFASFEILNLLVNPDTWHALILDDYRAVMPLPARKKFSLNYIFPPFFAPQLGIFANFEISPDLVTDFFDHIPNKFVTKDLILNKSNPSIQYRGSHFENISHCLDLNHDYQDLYNNFSSNTKRNIKSGQKHGYVIKIEKNIAPQIIALFENNRGREKDVNFSKNDYSRLEKIALVLEDANMCENYAVYTPSGQLAAGALFVNDHDRVWFWFSGRDNTLSEGKPLFFLINEFIKNNAGKDKLLDFNGSRNPNVAHLYKSFGGIPYSFAGFSICNNQILKFLLSFYRKLRTKKRRG